jgi:hypothetical protein
MVHCLEAGPSNSSFPASPHSGLEQAQEPQVALWTSPASSVIGSSIDGVEHLEREERAPGTFRVGPGALPGKGRMIKGARQPRPCAISRRPLSDSPQTKITALSSAASFPSRDLAIRPRVPKFYGRRWLEKMKPRACAGASRRSFQRCLENALGHPIVPPNARRAIASAGTQFWDAGPFSGSCLKSRRQRRL